MKEMYKIQNFKVKDSRRDVWKEWCEYIAELVIITRLDWDVLLDMNPARLNYLQKASLKVRAEQRCDMFRAFGATNGSKDLAKGLLKP